MEMDEDPEEWKKFYNKTREYVVFLLLFITLYFISYCLIFIFKKKNNGLFSGSYEDVVAYRISLWMCTFSLGVSIGAALLLPMSIISNEVLLAYPNSYYVQWLNSSLIQGMWNLVFLFSNLALFLLLPFSHLFIESEGFPGLKKGIKARVYESCLVLALVCILLLGITYIISSLFNDSHNSIASILSVSTHYLPFLYSCVSFLGVLMLLICTPVGFARLFSVIGKLLVKLKTPRRHLQDYRVKKKMPGDGSFDLESAGDGSFDFQSAGDGSFDLRSAGDGPFNLESSDDRPLYLGGSGDGSLNWGSSGDDHFNLEDSRDSFHLEIPGDGLHNSKRSKDDLFHLRSSLRMSPAASSIHRRRTYQNIPFEEYEEDRSTYLNEDGLDRMVAFLQTKESKIRHAAFKRNFLYPFMMIFLLLLTVLSMLMVAQNTLELCFGVKALPIYSENISLGINSLSSLGPIGASFEIILILYLWCTSIIGLYSLPLFCYLKPKVRDTSMTQVIGNCAILLILSSALPVLARSLGITNFDLLGDFGRINWLGNFYIVLFHNIMFAVTTAICLGTKITATARNELYLRIRNIRYSILYVFWVHL